MAKPLSSIASKPAGSPDRRFRGQIESAVADGVALDDMTLRLTLRDVSLLSRDPATPVTDISYANGVMRFLGVKIEKGGVPISALDRGAT
ncbi:MAG TPA: hypothetical protein VF474_05385 [Phenylobacterium sp.]